MKISPNAAFLVVMLLVGCIASTILVLQNAAPVNLFEIWATWAIALMVGFWVGGVLFVIFYLLTRGHGWYISIPPVTLLGLRGSYWLARLAGWRNQWRRDSSPKYWTVTRGGERRVEANFRWRDLWDKPALHYCSCCGRLEGQHHSALCANQNVLHPDGEIVR